MNITTLPERFQFDNTYIKEAIDAAHNEDSLQDFYGSDDYYEAIRDSIDGAMIYTAEIEQAALCLGVHWWRADGHTTVDEIQAEVYEAYRTYLVNKADYYVNQLLGIR